MKKALLLTIAFALFVAFGFSQAGKYWSANNESRSSITKYKAVARLAFPTEFKLFNLNIAPLRQRLLSVADNSVSHTTVISLPNANGQIEDFEVVEASNFEPALQARFPEIRAFSGKGITDRSATLKISLSPAGIQTMIFRSEKPCEFIEVYSQDRTVYAVYQSQRAHGQLPWTCSVVDQQLSAGLDAKVASSNVVGSSTGELKTMRLAQSVNGEYSGYFGATTAGTAADLALVYAGINATLTRCNGVYEKDLAIHLNLIAGNDPVIYFNPNTDPYTFWNNYTPPANGINDWNDQLQTALTANIGEANYDIGHMFGKSGGGGNAGCIGCVCVNNQKGSGITSPADNIPEGDNFDIDYVVHEVGHQMGAYHTFSFDAAQINGQNKEVGSGITIMGYAGITPYDVAPHSLDIYHETSIAQIQANMAGKTCPITTNISGTNATPVLAPVSNYTIPISTPFALTASATDANAGDVLTYCWEQDDVGTSANTGTNSKASANKATGPNWLSFAATTSPTRICPKLETVLAGALFTGPLPGGDAGYNIEYLSSVGRNLKFRCTVRDNAVYSSTAPISVGQTSFTDMTVTVTNTSGPFKVTQPNAAAISWAGGSTQTINWDVANSTAAPVSCANVKISLSVDGGYTWPYVLSATTANDGTESVTIPSVTATTTARVKVESIGNIFFDIDDFNFTITAAANGFSFNNVVGASVACGGPTSGAITLGTSVTGTFTTPINLTASGNPAGTTVSFATNPLTPGNSTTVTLSGMNTLAPGSYNVTITGTAGTVVQNSTLTYTVQPGTPPSITTQPTNVTICTGGNASFSVTSPTAGISYQWQVSTGGPFSDIPGATSATYSFTGTVTDNGNQYHVVITTLCGTVTSNNVTLTVNTAAAITTQPTSATECSGTDHTFSSTATGSNLTYQWQVSTGGPFTNIAGATSANLLLTAVTLGMNGYQYQVIVSGTGACAASVTSTAVTLTVVPGGNPAITTQPTAASVCSGNNTSFTVATSSAGVTYQWQVSTGGPFSNIAGATSATYSFVAAQGDDGNQYQVVISTPCGSTTSTPVGLIVNTAANITDQPDNVTLCAGADATFTVTATGTGLSYQWQSSTGGPFTNIAGATAATLSIPAVNIGLNGTQYQVVVSGTGTCAAPNTSNTVTLNVNAMPTANAAADITTVCSGGSVELSTPAGAGSYSWTASSGTVANPTSATTTVNPVVDPANPSAPLDIVYTVTATTAGCSSTSSVTVTASPLPAVTLVADPAITALTLPSQVVTLTANVVPPGTGYTYVWTQNGSVIANSTASLPVNVANVGEYDVTVSVSGACASTSDKINIADSIPDQFFVYPNPNDGQFSIQVRVPNKIGNVTVFDSKGARVFAQVNITDRPNAFELISVDLRPANSGVYVLVIYDKSGERLTSQRIIVQH
ncbi:MAG: zinc-dependent metalloprotease family protein [Ferruginibacter sp.]